MSIAEFNSIVPSNVNRIIEERGLKQNAVAKWAGFSTHQFNAMLNGRRLIKPCDISAIAVALGVKVDALFTERQHSA